MTKRFFLIIFLFFITNFSYWYNFSDTDLKTYIWEFNYEKSYLIDNLDFIVQAPLKTKNNWNKHYESCEEASLFLAHYNTNNLYFDNQSADIELEKLNFYEENNLWIVKDKKHNIDTDLIYLRDISIKEIYDLSKDYYWYTKKDIHIINSPSLETLKYLIYNNYILVVPSNTKILANPNFNQSTDSYHVIDLVWYDEYNFITLDPWTSRWAFYKYNFDKAINWIRNNWDKIIILEWKINKNNVAFNKINNQLLFSNKIDEILQKVDKILDKHSKNKEDILNKIIAKLDIQIKKYKNNNSSQVLTLLGLELDKKLKIITGEKKIISQFSDKVKEYY